MDLEMNASAWFVFYPLLVQSYSIDTRQTNCSPLKRSISKGKNTFKKYIAFRFRPCTKNITIMISTSLPNFAFLAQGSGTEKKPTKSLHPVETPRCFWDPEFCILADTANRAWIHPGRLTAGTWEYGPPGKGKSSSKPSFSGSSCQSSGVYIILRLIKRQTHAVNEYPETRTTGDLGTTYFPPKGV